MPPKAAPITATASRSTDVQDTSMADVTTTSNDSNRAWFKDTL